MIRPFAFLGCILVLLSFGCSRTVRIPPADYADPGGAVAYHIRTVDHRTFSVAEYSVSDSTIVVRRLTGSASPSTEDAPKVPFEIALDNVESIDRVTVHTGRSILIAVVVTGVIGGFLLWLFTSL